jgi:CpeT/CpcT family (DUF1001)
MILSSELIALGKYLAGEFDNQQQAFADPVWYVHLRLWLQPVSLFSTDSITLFAEQASVVNLDRPYRQRILRLQQSETDTNSLQVQYYMLKDTQPFIGAGSQPELLQQLTLEQIEFLPGCRLDVKIERVDSNSYHFSAFPTTDKPCCFTYQGNTYQVFLAFEVNSQELLTYDKGIDPNTGKAIWGALLGPFRFKKISEFWR